MIGTSFHQRNTRNITAHSVTNSIIIILLTFLFSIFPQRSHSEEYQVPQHIIDICIVASPFVTAGQLVSDSRLGSENPVRVAKSAHSLYSLLTKSPLTPDACRDELPRAIEELDRFMFVQSLRLCSNAEVSAIGTDYQNGNWYCSTLEQEDWRQFREWLPTEAGQAWIEEHTGLTAEDVFMPPPKFDVSQYMDTPTDLDGWHPVGSGGAIINDIGFQLTALCDGGATLILGGGVQYGGARANLEHDSRLDLFTYDTIDNYRSVQLSWLPGPGTTSVEIPLTQEALDLLRTSSGTVGIDSDPFGVRFSTTGISEALVDCVAQEDEVPDLASNPMEVVGILQNYHSSGNSCVDVGMRRSLDLFGDSLRNKEVRDFCSAGQSGELAHNALLDVFQPCGITNFTRSGQTYAFFEYLLQEGIIVKSTEIYGDIVARIRSGNGPVGEIHLNRNNTLCGMFHEIEYEVTLRNLRKVGEGYFSVDYSVRQYSRNPAVAGVIFRNWNPTLTRTLIFDPDTEAWVVSD